MLAHVVLFKLNDPAADADRLVEALRALPAQIPEIRDYQAGKDVTGGPTSYDVGLWSTFDDDPALQRYRHHPAHQEVLDLVEEITETRVAVDWEL
jgi:hypothetical protein